MRMSIIIAASVFLMETFLLVPASHAEALKPFKDDLFSSSQILEQRNDGAFEIVDYQEMRDINERDQIPEKRVKQAYVSLGVRKAQVDETITFSDRRIEVTRVGQPENAAFSVIFVHGRGGDRRLGMNDYSFGGNFNRLKNLAFQNGGVYYAPSVKTFDSEGVADIASLIAYAHETSKGHPVILSCASMGSFICWGIARDPKAVQNLKGMVIMGGPADPAFSTSAFHKAKCPIWFTHGSHDSVYKAGDQEALFEKILKSGSPTHFTLFQTGSHGTPIRMTDWRRVLNWILAS